MTKEETILADKLLQEATVTQNPNHRRAVIEDYDTFVKATLTRSEATADRRQSCMMATGMVATGNCSKVE